MFNSSRQSRRCLKVFLLSVVLLACLQAQVTSGAYNQVNNGGALTRRSTLTFSGAGVSCVDDAGTKATICTITGGLSAAITSINSQTGPAITLTTGTSGTDFAVSPSGNTITLNLPDASATARGAITTGTQTIAGAKTLSGVATFQNQEINTLNNAASTPPVSIVGTWFTGGSATTTKPQVLVEPSGTTSTGWSTNGTGIGINAATGFTGRLLDAQVNGATVANIAGNGVVTSTNSFVVGGSTLASNSLTSTSTQTIQTSSSATTTGNAVSITFSNTKTITSGQVTTLSVIGTFAPTSGSGQVNGITLNHTVNQTSAAAGLTFGLNLNPTLTSVVNYKHILLNPATQAHNITGTVTEREAVLFGAQTYTAASALTITTAATLKIDAPIASTNVTFTNGYALWVNTGNSFFQGSVISATSQQVTAVAVTSLPTCNAAAEGSRASVNDSSVTTFLSTVANGGANKVPVYCNGTNWIVG